MSTSGSIPGSGRQLGVLLAIFDFPMLNVGLREVIDAEPDMRVLGEASSREAMREEVLASGADVVVTECLPYDHSGCTSFQMIEAIRAAKPGIRILAVECRCSSEQFSLAIKAGADGFLTREAQVSDFVTAIRSISRGQTYVSPSIVTRMVNTYVLKTPGGTLEDPYETLSEREREVMLLAAVGHTNREIARTLHLAEQTVHNYRANVMEKLGFHDRVELLKYAIRRGLIDVADL
ncbi:MAG: response regulator transcription factor [Chloroflexi bacterium]|nr:response regulator transcription factor [Chloroflexota bacterium]